MTTVHAGATESEVFERQGSTFRVVYCFLLCKGRSNFGRNRNTVSWSRLKAGHLVSCRFEVSFEVCGQESASLDKRRFESVKSMCQCGKVRSRSVIAPTN